jgi:hypothetical protein
MLWGLIAFFARDSGSAGGSLNPAFFYGANLIAHAASAALVYLILCRLFQTRWAAWLGAAAFALHPIQVEAVANAWDLYTPLSAALSLLAIWRYLIFSDRAGSGDPTQRSRAKLNYVFASVAFFCALLSKPTVAIVPVMIAAIELGIRRRNPSGLLMRLTPWLAAAFVVAWLDQRIPATGRVYVPDVWLRPLVPLDAIGFYLGKILLPIRLCMDYGRTPWVIAGKPAIRVTCLITLALFTAALVLRKRWPVAATAFVVFVVALLPTIGIVPFTFQYYSTVADRYVYLAMLGPAIGVAALLARYHNKRSMIAASMAIALLAALSVAQMRHWADDWKLAAYTLEVNPRSASAAGTFQYLLGNRPLEKFPGQIVPTRPRCTLGSSELIRAGDRLSTGGNPDLAAECYQRASNPIAP